MAHYILTRYEHGHGSGPGSGYQAPDRIEVMASSRTSAGLLRKRKQLGGTIRKVPGDYRRYSHNELLNYVT